MQERRRLVPLSDVEEFRVSPQAPDVRGWPAVLPDGTAVGQVTDLIVDRAVGRVRYVELVLTDAPDGQARHVLVPIGTAQVDAMHDQVIVPAATLVMVADRMTYERGTVTRQHEEVIRRQVLGVEHAPGEDRGQDRGDEAREGDGREADDAFYAAEHYDERRFLAPRRGEGAEEVERDADFSYLVGVGGAMTERDTHPEPVGDLGAGQIRVPVMKEDRRPEQQR